jgi:hypothetical protein
VPLVLAGGWWSASGSKFHAIADGSDETTRVGTALRFSHRKNGALGPRLCPPFDFGLSDKGKAAARM